MDVSTLLTLVANVGQTVTTLTGLVNEAKATASESDQAKLNEALADLNTRRTEAVASAGTALDQAAKE